MVKSKIEQEFDRAMMDIYVRAKDEAGYVATIFLRMLCDHGGLETAKRLINDRAVSSGYTALWERKRLDLTVEATVTTNAKWHELFSPNELDISRKRLAQYGYEGLGAE